VNYSGEIHTLAHTEWFTMNPCGLSVNRAAEPSTTSGCIDTLHPQNQRFDFLFNVMHALLRGFPFMRRGGAALGYTVQRDALSPVELN
jgi:hypothetical protein